ncbi:MAG: hypothetical protein AB1752_14135 [Candidatus Zixiibacteriota bacterium]
MIDLDRELSTAGDASEAVRVLTGLGADRLAILSWPLFGAVGVSSIVPQGDGLYRPGRIGTRAIILGVRDESTSEIIDLLAFPPERPDHWRRRTGLAMFLGEAAVSRAAFMGEPIDVFPDPLAWLQAGAFGCVILDPTISLRFWFAGIPELRAATADLGRRIDDRLRREPELRRPRVVVLKERVAA